MPHSDFLAWLSNATLKFLSQVFQVWFWCCKKQIWSVHWVDWEDDFKNEDNLKNEADLKNEEDLKNENHLKNEEDLKNKDDLKNEDDLK